MATNNLSETKMEESMEYCLGRVSSSGQLLYLLLIITISTFLILLTVIRINLSISARGILRPEAEISLLHSLYPGKVEKVFVTEGEAVCPGDTLLMLEVSSLRQSMRTYLLRKKELCVMITDLQMILNRESEEPVSPEIWSAYRQFADRHDDLELKLSKARKERIRMERLFSEKLIPEKDYDDLRYQERLLEKEIEVLKSGFRKSWLDLHSQYRQDLFQLNSDIEKLESEIHHHTFIAPVKGHIDEFAGIYPGSTVTASQLLFRISPDTSLIAELYVPASRSGYMYPGQQVRILVDAYNHREWGALSSRVSDISSDAMIVDNTPVFRVRCKLDRKVMFLRNGAEGTLKQGMTCRARFYLSRRTLIQVVFDRAGKWFSPIPPRKEPAT